MWSAKYWRDLTERIISSAAGGALAAVTVSATTGSSSSINWAAVGISAGVAALVSLLKGLIASQKGDASSASLVE